MTEYTYSVSGRVCTIRNARNGMCIRQLSRSEDIDDVMISGETATLVTESGSAVYDLRTGAVIRQFR